jgi:hypothetical protein
MAPLVASELAAAGIQLTDTEVRFVAEATARHRLRLRELQQTPMSREARELATAVQRTRYGDELARLLPDDLRLRVVELYAVRGGGEQRTQKDGPARAR